VRHGRHASRRACGRRLLWLTTADVAMAANGQPEGLNNEARPGIVALKSELDRLADEVVGMAKALTLGS
jgi:hypothetical protein